MLEVVPVSIFILAAHTAQLGKIRYLLSTECAHRYYVWLHELPVYRYSILNTDHTLLFQNRTRIQNIPSNYADLDQDPQKSKLFEKEQIIRVPILSLYKSRLHDFLWTDRPKKSGLLPSLTHLALWESGGDEAEVEPDLAPLVLHLPRLLRLPRQPVPVTVRRPAVKQVQKV